MTHERAVEALATIGTPTGVEQLAGGMSSNAWVGVVDGQRWVVRVPVGDGRRPTPRYRDEARLLLAAETAGVPVAVPVVRRLGDVECAIALEVAGRPVRREDWSPQLYGDVGAALRRLHALDPALAIAPDLVTRFHLAAIWPFDESRLNEHPVAQTWPELVPLLHSVRGDVVEAARPASGLVHSDLHPAHVLVDAAGGLAGLLDFGDVFVGSASWDHAGLWYYHGRDVADRCALGVDVEAAMLIAVAFVMYKLAKTPERDDVVARVEPILRNALAETAR